MSLLRPTTHVDPARVHLVLQLIPAAADALVHHLLGPLTAAIYIGRSVAWCQHLVCNHFHTCMPSESVVKGCTACLAG